MPEEIDANEQAYPAYWFKPPQVLSAQSGMRRWVWDLHYPPPEGVGRSFPISAIYYNTPTTPLGPAVLPGEYTVRLIADGRTNTQLLTVKMDPRVTASAKGLEKMFAVSILSYRGMALAREAGGQVQSLRTQLRERRANAGQGAVADAVAALDQKALALAGNPGGRGGRRGGDGAGAQTTFSGLVGDFGNLMGLVEAFADAMPTSQAVSASEQLQKSLHAMAGRVGTTSSARMLRR